MATLRHLFTKYKRPFYKKPKALTHLFTTHQAPFAATNYAAAIQNGYEKNVIVHRAVNLIARSTGSVPLALYAHNKKVAHHALLTLLRQPNPFQGSNVFMESIVSHLLLSGNAYVEALNTQDEVPPLRIARFATRACAREAGRFWRARKICVQRSRTNTRHCR